MRSPGCFLDITKFRLYDQWSDRDWRRDEFVVQAANLWNLQHQLGPAFGGTAMEWLYGPRPMGTTRDRFVLAFCGGKFALRLDFCPARGHIRRFPSRFSMLPNAREYSP